MKRSGADLIEGLSPKGVPLAEERILPAFFEELHDASAISSKSVVNKPARPFHLSMLFLCNFMKVENTDALEKACITLQS